MTPALYATSIEGAARVVTALVGVQVTRAWPAPDVDPQHYPDGWLVLVSWVNGNGVQAVVQWVRDLRKVPDVVSALPSFAREEAENASRGHA